jgi:ParB/RepB/Spo0J family partition protein
MTTTITYIHPQRLAPSRYNPRSPDHQSCSDESLDELTNSILSQGIMEPILVRPLLQINIARYAEDDEIGVNTAPDYEIVFGHRRWMAAKRAGLDTIPCMVKAMTETEVVEAQIHENLEREGVAAVDEGAAMLYLKQQHGMTAEQIMARTGKTRSYVYGRMRMAAELTPEVKSMQRSGKLDAEVALLITRIASPKLQIKAAADLQGVSFRIAQQRIAADYATDLKRHAGWDMKDATLLESAGDCFSCRYRSGNDPTDTGGNPDVCTNIDCFKQKRLAHFRGKLGEHAAQGFDILEFESENDATGYWRTWNNRPGMLSYNVLRDRLMASSADASEYEHLLTYVLINNTKHPFMPPQIIQMISTDQADKLVSLYRTHVEPLAESGRKAGSVELDNPALARDHSLESSGPVTVIDGKKTDAQEHDGGAGEIDSGDDPAVATNAILDRLAHRVLRSRDGRETVDLVWVCAALACTSRRSTQELIGLDTTGGVLVCQDIIEQLADLSPDELGRIAVACAISQALLWTDDGGHLEEVVQQIELRWPQATAGSQSRPVAYRHPDTGEAWSGKGLMPKWLRAEIDAGGSLNDFVAGLVK